MSEAPRKTPTYGVHFVLFRDCDRIWYRVDETGFNKIGYVTRRHTVIYPRLNRSLTEAPAGRIRRYPHQVLQLTVRSEADVHNVERFFTENEPSIELFNYGVAAAAVRQDLSFFENPVRIPILDTITPEEFERRWAVFRKILRPADTVAVIDTKSLRSRLIARFDQGTWSHVGAYSGNGTILEAISARCVERDIEVYHKTRYRLGAYRMNSLDERAAGRVVSWARSQLGASYNTRGAVRLAAFKLFGIKPQGEGTKNVSPNDIARSERFSLVHVV
jgi:hypothetical protein